MKELFGVLGMLLTVGAVLALAYFSTRYLALRGFPRPGGASQGGLRMLDQLPLGREQRVVLVQVGETYLLLGVTASNISQLAQLSEEDAGHWKDQLGPQAQADGMLGLRFRDALKQSLGRNTKQGGDAP